MIHFVSRSLKEWILTFGIPCMFFVVEENVKALRIVLARKRISATHFFLIIFLPTFAK